jgi:hypothetical protein
MFIKDLTAPVKRSTIYFADSTDQEVASYILDALDKLAAKGLLFRVVDGGTWDTIAITSPRIDPTLRSIIVLQTKIIGLRTNPFKSIAITGLRQEFEPTAIFNDELELDREISDFFISQNPGLFVQNEYDVLTNLAVQIRTLKSMFFPTDPHL